jgi:hypothetical protein
MSKSAKQSQRMLVSAMLILAASVALNSPPTFSETTQRATSDNTVRNASHRHGPSGKGFHHTQRHEKSPSMDRRQVSPRRYGPPSKGFRTWSQSSRAGRPLLEDTAVETKSRRRGPPGKFPWSRR